MFFYTFLHCAVRHRPSRDRRTNSPQFPLSRRRRPRPRSALRREARGARRPGDAAPKSRETGPALAGWAEAPPCLQPAPRPGRAGPGRGHRPAPLAHVPAAPAAHGSDGGAPQPGERGERRGRVGGRVGSARAAAAPAAQTAGRG